MEDKELFDLCQKVYEKTGWNNTEFLWVAPPLNDTDYKVMHKSKLHQLNDYIANPDMIDKMYNSTFCYDSDYLLEKLPTKIKDKNLGILAWLSMDNLGHDGWQYSYRPGSATPILKVLSDTPLKALLKLTVELAEAGEL